MRFVRIVALVMTLSGLALAQTKPLAESLGPRARPLYDAGIALAKKNDWAGALAQFTAAHDAQPEPRLLWNMAACEKNLGHHAKAHALVVRYLGESKGSITPKEREQAEQFATVLGALVSPITIESEPSGATVSLDGLEVGKTPATIDVDIGAHVFRLQLEGRKPIERQESIAGASPRTIRVALEPYTAQLKVTTRPPASLVLDGKPIGTGTFAGAVDAGDHALDASAKGYVTSHVNLALRPDEQRVLELPLDPLPSKPVLWPWYVAAGVAVAAGLVVGGYFLFHVERTTPVPGTLGSFRVP